MGEGWIELAEYDFDPAYWELFNQLLPEAIYTVADDRVPPKVTIEQAVAEHKALGHLGFVAKYGLAFR